MDNPDAQIAELKETLTQLERRVEALSHELNRAVRIGREYDGLLDRQGHILQAGLTDAFARIKDLEFSVFPNLARDMVAVYRLVGEGENRADNPLDRRSGRKP